MHINSSQVERTLTQVLTWSKQENYKGYSKHDGLNSPLLSRLTFNQKWLRLIYTQIITRAPINLRPWVGVPKERNPKGIGLFAHALLDLQETEIYQDVEKSSYLREAEILLAWLIEYQKPWSTIVGKGWGYHYDWQDVGFFQPKHFPNRVVTCWIGFAFLKAYALTQKEQYLDILEQIYIFLIENPKTLYEDQQMKCLSYVPIEEISWAVMDVSALVSSFCAQLALLTDTRCAERREQARKLMQFVVDKQTEYGGWYYTWPAKDSHIKHDNYHTGIILDCLCDYMHATHDYQHHHIYQIGLDYYKKTLFLENGAPKWMNDQTYPHDIHGAAAGILAFTRAAQYYLQDQANPEQALYYFRWGEKVLTWTLGHLYHSSGYFYYQQTAWYTKRFCLMRWGNAWMSRALAQYLKIYPRFQEIIS